MNPLMMIGQMMKNGGNPQQIFQQMMGNNPSMNNPIMKNAFEMAQKGDSKGVEELARNLCRESVLYPLTQPGCEPVSACGIKTRTRYATIVHTSADSGTFRLCKRVCCTTNNLRAINGEGTAVAPGPTGGDA